MKGHLKTDTESPLFPEYSEKINGENNYNCKSIIFSGSRDIFLLYKQGCAAF